MVLVSGWLFCCFCVCWLVLGLVFMLLMDACWFVSGLFLVVCGGVGWFVALCLCVLCC